MIPKSTRERWRALLADATPRPWLADGWQREKYDGNYFVRGAGVTTEEVANCGNSGRYEENASLIAEAPDAMSQLLDENDRLRELVREMCGIAVMSLNHLDRCAEAKAARIAAVASEIGDE